MATRSMWAKNPSSAVNSAAAPGTRAKHPDGILRSISPTEVVAVPGAGKIDGLWIPAPPIVLRDANEILEPVGDPRMTVYVWAAVTSASSRRAPPQEEEPGWN